jgi:TPR repeat protein
VLIWNRQADFGAGVGVPTHADSPDACPVCGFSAVGRTREAQAAGATVCEACAGPQSFKPDWGIDMKFIALAFSCFLFFSMPANANEADRFNAMVALANKGDAEAQYHVGMMYNNGIGTQQDPRQAFEWFQKSTASNDPLGAYKLGCYYDGQGAGIVTADANEALKYKLIAAKAGYALAQHDVASLYGRQDNFEEAAKWLKLAGDQGYPDALYRLSGLYFEGKGAPRDLSLAYAYFKLSNRVPRTKVNEMAAILSKPELAKAEKLVSEWKPQPTALTLKAKRGITAADEHLKTTRN